MSSNLQFFSDIKTQLSELTKQVAAVQTQLSAKQNGSLSTEAIGALLAREGQITREDFAGKLAALITPYIEQVVRRIADMDSKQTELEAFFKQHEVAVRSTTSELDAAFVKMRKETAKDWKAQREQVQADLGHLDEFVKWLLPQLEKNAKDNVLAVAKCTSAVAACEALLVKITKPVEQSIQHLDRIYTQGETVINEAAERLRKTYARLREPILWRVTYTLAAMFLMLVLMSGFIFWRTRAAINTNWQEMTEHSEQQKQEMKGLLEQSLKEARESQIDGEIKVKMWDSMLKSLSPQQQEEVIRKYRELVSIAERKRIDDQMGASYEQMNRKKK
jgi:hypothetical protein